MLLPFVTTLALTFAAPPARAEEPKPAPAAQAKRELVPGTRVKLVAPAGHEPGRGFLGYSWPENGASLIVMEMPGPYAETVKGMDEKGLARGGMTLIEGVDAKVCGRDGRLLFVSQSSQGIDFKKWLALCGDEKRTLLLVAVFPKELESELSASFKSVLLGAEWDPTLEVDPFAVLPWSTARPEGLRFAGNMGTAYLYTEDGEVVQKAKPASARVVISPSAGEARIDDLRVFTEKRARALPYVGKQLEIVSSSAFDVGGRRGWELVGKSKHEKEALDLLVHVVILASEDEYVMFGNQSAFETRDTWLPRFRACAKSWKLKEAPAPTAK